MTRNSQLFAVIGVGLLIAAPWVVLSARWPVYVMGVAAVALAAIFRLSND